jgi:hypothetical protein
MHDTTAMREAHNETMQSTAYPLGHSTAEFERLEARRPRRSRPSRAAIIW